MYCGECKQECDVHKEDDSFDYDGPFGTQTEHCSHLESTCCGADVFLDEACTEPASPSDIDHSSRYDYDDDDYM